MKEQLYRVARNTLQQKLDEKKKSSGDDYALLMGDGVSFTGELYEVSSGQKVGDFAEEIELKGTVMVTAITYDKKATVNYLTDVFREGLLSGTDKEVGTDTESLRMSNLLSQSDS